MKVTISDAIRYIGVDDTTIDLFESQYVVPEGVSYNSYLILDEKVALMDTVDARGAEAWEKNLMDTLAGRKVDYLVISHLEPDHAGIVPGSDAGGQCQDLCHAATVFPGWCDGVRKINGQRGRYLIFGQPYTDLCHGTYGTLAGSYGFL